MLCNNAIIRHGGQFGRRVINKRSADTNFTCAKNRAEMRKNEQT